MIRTRLLHSIIAAAVMPAALTGCRNQLAFSTSTKFGIDISQRADQQPEVTVGYQRTEIASIPVREQRVLGTNWNKIQGGKTKPRSASVDTVGSAYNGDADQTNDAYAVLGTFRVTYEPEIAKSSGVHIHQLFATGLAARNAANDTNMAKVFGAQANPIVNATTNTSTNR